LKDVCEKRLFKEISEGMEELRREVKGIEVVNDTDEKEYMERFEIEIVDRYHVFGCDIDRAKNAELGLKRFKVPFFREEDETFRMYIPAIGLGLLDYLLPLTLVTVVRIETNLKLNLIDPEG
jgi:hypothetical protein